MLEHPPNMTADRHAEEPESEGLDVEKLREWIGFALRATRRHSMVAALTFVTIAALGITAAKVMPRLYTAQVKLLAQRSAPIRILTAPNPTVDTAENPTKNVAALVMGQDNLESLARDANLVERFEATRPHMLQWKDRLMARLYGAPSERDKLLAMTFTLERQLTVEPDDMTVTITVDWNNPQVAYDLVTLVQKNFSEARYDSDVAVVNASIAVLEEHAKTELARVDDELKEYNKNVVEKAKLSRPVTTPSGVARLVRSTDVEPATSAEVLSAPDPELIATLEEKRLRVRASEEAQQRTVEALRQELQRQELALTPMHPTVILLRQQLEAASQPSPELAQLRQDLRALMAQIAVPKTSPLRSTAPSASSHPSSFLLGPAPSASASGDAPLPLIKDEVLAPLALSESRLSLAMKAYQDALARLDAAKIELDIARSVYKERYKLLSPAEVPRSPKKATPRLVALGSVFGGGLLAVVLAAVLDLIGGAILEVWQIRRRLKLDVLGEIDSPP